MEKLKIHDKGLTSKGFISCNVQREKCVSSLLDLKVRFKTSFQSYAKTFNQLINQANLLLQRPFFLVDLPCPQMNYRTEKPNGEF